MRTAWHEWDQAGSGHSQGRHRQVQTRGKRTRPRARLHCEPSDRVQLVKHREHGVGGASRTLRGAPWNGRLPPSSSRSRVYIPWSASRSVSHCNSGDLHVHHHLHCRGEGNRGTASWAQGTQDRNCRPPGSHLCTQGWRPLPTLALSFPVFGMGVCKCASVHQQRPEQPWLPAGAREMPR